MKILFIEKKKYKIIDFFHDFSIFFTYLFYFFRNERFSSKKAFFTKKIFNQFFYEKDSQILHLLTCRMLMLMLSLFHKKNEQHVKLYFLLKFGNLCHFLHFLK